MKVLVGCEHSGVVRDAFLERGHYAMSCDLLPTDSPRGDRADIACADGNTHSLLTHYQGNLLYVLGEGREEFPEWDLAIFHPDCTYLTISAEWAYRDHQTKKIKPGTLIGAERRAAREQALAFVEELWHCGIPRICIENPVGVINSRLPFMPKPQYIQPHQFGHDASKRTGLWLKNLPPLVPTEIVEPRYVNGLPRWGNQTDGGWNKLAPSEDRWKLRSRTYEGLAKAMAEQWGRL